LWFVTVTMQIWLFFLKLIEKKFHLDASKLTK